MCFKFVTNRLRVLYSAGYFVTKFNTVCVKFGEIALDNPTKFLVYKQNLFTWYVACDQQQTTRNEINQTQLNVSFF